VSHIFSPPTTAKTNCGSCGSSSSIFFWV